MEGRGRGEEDERDKGNKKYSRLNFVVVMVVVYTLAGSMSYLMKALLID